MVWSNKIILLIDDEPQICELIIAVFTRLGAKVLCAESGEERLRIFFDHRPHLVVLDIILPGLNGVEVVTSIRQLCNTPIVLLSAAQESQLILGCLQAGADEYVAKPFSPEELVARCSSVMGRDIEADSRPAGEFAFDDGYLTIDHIARRLIVEGRQVKLTPTEFRILRYLVVRKGLVCRFDQILDSVWGEDDPYTVEKIHTFIWQLRRKIEPSRKKPTYILSEYGIGYRFVGD